MFECDYVNLLAEASGRIQIEVIEKGRRQYSSRSGDNSPSSTKMCISSTMGYIRVGPPMQ